jgi:hypothetical protein
VTDVQNGNGKFVLQRQDVRQDFVLAILIEPGKRLVHQQQPWTCGKGTGDGNPPPFAARQGGGLAREQGCDVKQFTDTFNGKLAFRPGHAIVSVLQVVPDIQVGKQAALLENVRKGPAVGRHEVSVGLPVGIVDGQVTTGMLVQSPDGTQQRGLPAARWSENGSHALRRDVQVHVQLETVFADLESGSDGHGCKRRNRRLML